MPEKWFSRERLVNALKGLRILHFRISHSSLLTVSILSIALFLAFMVRLLPLRWGYYLSEFDPYFHYRSAEYLVENGYAAWDSWVDYMRWHPFGQQISRVSYPGIAMTTASLYVVLRALGLPITLFQLHIIFPVIMGTLACLVIYFFAKDIGGKEAGLFAALFLALNASYIGRTSLGFCDDEAVGIFALLLFSFFFLRSIEKERPLRSNLIYAVGAGLSLGYMCTSWGAARYPISMTALFVFILILLRRYSPHLLLSYGVSFGIAFFIAAQVPTLGGFRFLIETFNLPVLAVFLLLCLCELFRHVQSLKTKVILTSSFFVLAVAAFFLAGELGFFGATPGKFLTVLNPLVRGVITESVAEHRPGAWASFYYEYGIGAFLIPVGLFFALQNPTNRNIYLSIFTLTTIYFASSMIRLTLLMAPAFCILWAVALVRVLRPFVAVMKEAPVIPRRKMHFGAHVGKEFSAAFIIIMLILLIFPFYLPELRPFTHAYSPATIAAASAPIRPSETVTDWLDTLEWMQVNLPSTAVVCSWWDYGYWISILGNQTTLADNGTINTTQIGTIGLMFVSNETEAIKILKTYDVTHVVVFTTFSVNQQYQVVEYGWGDEGKWHWMLRIAGSVYPELGLNESDYGNWTQQGGWQWNENGTNTVIYKLMHYGAETKALGTSTISLEYFRPVYLSRADSSRTGGVYILVCVYEVTY